MHLKLLLLLVCLCCTLAAIAQPEVAQPDPLQQMNMLVEQLKTAQERSVRAYTADKLGSLGLREAVPALIEALKDDPQVAGSAANALARLGDHRAVPALLAALDLANEGKFNPHVEVLQALAVLADPAMKDRLVAMLSENWRPYTLVFALDALETLRDPAVAGALRPLIDGEKGAGVSGRAMLLAARLGDHQAVPAILKQLDRRGLVSRKAAVEALSLLRDPAAVEPLKTMLNDPEPLLRTMTVRALAAYRKPTLLDSFTKALADPDAVVRTEAAVALGQCGNTGAIPALVTALQDGNLGVRNAAADALGVYGKAAVPPVKALLATAISPDVRAAAVRALGATGRAEAIPEVTNALRDPDPCVRAAATAILPLLGPVAVPNVQALLADEDSDVRARAAETLGRMKAPPTAALVAAVKDPTAEVRRWAVWALGECPGDAPAPPILAALDDSDLAVRCEALRITGACKFTAAALLLAQRINTGAPEENDAVLATLRAISDKDFGADREQWLQWARTVK